jgi:hypothetical protein
VQPVRAAIAPFLPAARLQRGTNATQGPIDTT